MPRKVLHFPHQYMFARRQPCMFTLSAAVEGKTPSSCIFAECMQRSWQKVPLALHRVCFFPIKCALAATRVVQRPCVYMQPARPHTPATPAPLETCSQGAENKILQRRSAETQLCDLSQRAAGVCSLEAENQEGWCVLVCVGCSVRSCNNYCRRRSECFCSTEKQLRCDYCMCDERWVQKLTQLLEKMCES